MAPAEGASAEELRRGLYAELRGAGVVDGLKTRLRAEVRPPPPPPPAHPYAHGCSPFFA